jgi:hydroxymethylglutaryl-CoA reductase (NADPH)
MCYNIHITRKEPIMPAIPPFVLKKLYVKGSLRAEDDGFALDIKNTIAPATIVAFTGLDVDVQAWDTAQVTLILPSGSPCPMSEITTKAPLLFPVGAIVTLRIAGKTLDLGSHELTIHVIVQEVGPLDIPVSDTLG